MLITLTSINDVKYFVEKANDCTHAISVSSGRYRVDGKSLLGMFSLNLDNPVKLVIEGDLTAEAVKIFLDAIKEYIVATT